MRVYALLGLKRYEEAVQACDEVIAIRRRQEGLTFFDWADALKGYALARMGRPADADAVLQQLHDRSASPMNEAYVLLGLRRYDEALDRLHRAVVLRDGLVTFFGVDPRLDELREMPAFKELLKAVNLLEVSEKTRVGR